MCDPLTLGLVAGGSLLGAAGSSAVSRPPTPKAPARTPAPAVRSKPVVKLNEGKATAPKPVNYLGANSPKRKNAKVLGGLGRSGLSI